MLFDTLKITLVVTILLLTGCAQHNEQVFADSDTVAMSPEVVPEQELSATEDALGIRVESLRMTAAGYMLDFRYHVYNSDKSLPLVDRSVHPYLVHHDSGAYLGIPSPSKIGALRQTPRSHYPDRTYFMLFANPGGLVKSGDVVDIVHGEYRFENLTVE